MENPLVSIVTPVLNGAKYLEICIGSVLEQTYPHIEHIFIDGGSKDGTLELLSQYRAKYPDRIKVISELDAGVGEAVSNGMRMAKGDILGWLDSDDLYEPDAVLSIVQFFRSNKDAYFVFGESDVIDEAGNVIQKRLIKDFDLREAINDRHYIVFCAAFYRREVTEKVGFFNTLGNDLDFWIRAGKEFQLHRIDKLLSHWRRHQGGITMSGAVRDRNIDRQRFKEDYDLCRRYGGNFLAPRIRRYYIFTILDRLGLYHFVNFTLLPRLRRYAFLSRILKLLGA